jgi:hypothetical protein
LLKVELQKGDEVLNSAISHARLMRESEHCIEAAARNGGPVEQLVAGRILESPVVWRRWENEHAGLMRTVSGQRRAVNQTTALKTACFSMIHRKALFEHLRDHQVRGDERRQIVQYFHRTSGYTHAAVAEHDIYLRSACSYLCSNQVGGELIRDGVFDEPMLRYEELYAEYFKLFCDSVFGAETVASASSSLLPYLRYRLAEQRLAVLAMPRITPAAAREARLRQRTGDTVKVNVDALRAQLQTTG